MRRREEIAAGIAGAAALLAAAPAHAAEGGGSLLELAFQTANLALLLAVLVYYGRKPLTKFFAERRSRIKSELDEAAGLLEAAERRYAEWQRKLIDLEQEVDGIRAEGRRRAEDEGRLIRAEAQAAAERIQRDATAAIEQELLRAQSALRAEAADLATQMARQILEEKLGEDDRERLMDEFIVHVEGGGSARGATR